MAYRIIFVLLLFFLVSCSPIKINMESRDISLFPVILNSDYPQELVNEEIQILKYTVKVLERDLNVKIHIENIYYTNVIINVSCEYDIKKQLKVDNDSDIIVFFYNKTMCQNVLGCAQLNGILFRPTYIYVTMEGDLLQDTMALVHEIGHVLGAPHQNEGYIMNPYMNNISILEFSEDDKDAITVILKLFDQLNAKACLFYEK